MSADPKDTLISLSSLIDVDSIEKFLVDGKFLTRSSLKKKLSKKARANSVRSRAELKIPISILNCGIIAPYTGNKSFQVIDQNNEILAIYKPENTHCYPLSYKDSDTVVNWIRNYDNDLLNVNSLENDRGLLYRLDYETSGVLLYAKTDEIYHSYRSRFNQKSIKKYYAIVSGEIDSSGNLHHWLKGSGIKKNFIQASISQIDGSQEAVLSYKKISYCSANDCSLVEVILNTGLRHQIRVQLAQIGFPILGDQKYGGKSSDRLYLHAYSYQLKGHSVFSARPQGERDLLFDNLLSLNS